MKVSTIDCKKSWLWNIAMQNTNQICNFWKLQNDQLFFIKMVPLTKQYYCIISFSKHAAILASIKTPYISLCDELNIRIHCFPTEYINRSCSSIKFHQNVFSSWCTFLKISMSTKWIAVVLATHICHIHWFISLGVVRLIITI